MTRPAQEVGPGAAAEGVEDRSAPEAAEAGRDGAAAVEGEDDADETDEEARDQPFLKARRRLGRTLRRATSRGLLWGDSPR